MVGDTSEGLSQLGMEESDTWQILAKSHFHKCQLSSFWKKKKKRHMEASRPRELIISGTQLREWSQMSSSTVGARCLFFLASHRVAFDGATGLQASFLYVTSPLRMEESERGHNVVVERP